jgi:hypothetical protein
MKNELYILNKGTFETKPRKERVVQKRLQELDVFTLNFKLDVVQRMNNILKFTYGGKKQKMIKQVIKNIDTMKGIDFWKDSLALIKDNMKIRKMIDYYDTLKTKKETLSDVLNNWSEQLNSLSALDQYIIEMEDGYSEMYDEFYNIEKLCKDFSRDKIITAFIFYLFTGRYMKLKEDDTFGDVEF